MNYNSQLFQPSISERLFHGFYSLLLSIFYVVALLIFVGKALFKPKDFRKRKLQRFGFLPKIQKQGGILLHCVSVGEVVAASALVKRIRANQPDYPFTITTTTATGCERVKQIFSDSVVHFYLPYDLNISMKSLINRVRPEKVLITEVELWPNLIDVCWKKHIPVYILNARLTDKSARRYDKFSLLFSPMLQKITAVCAQGERDFINYKQSGLSEEKLFLTNNIKFDQPLSEQDIAKAESIKQQLKTHQRPVLLGASTHEPEEQTLIESYLKLKTTHPELLLVITPRHPQRFKKVEKLLHDAQLQVLKFSDQQAVKAETDAVLVDAMGILKSLYAIATYAFVGGSIASRGGHNALEAALFSKPILMGDSIHNNPVICQTLIDAGAMKIIKDSDSLAAQVNEWLQSPDDAKSAGEAGSQVIHQNAGAINKTLQIIGSSD